MSIWNVGGLTACLAATALFAAAGSAYVPVSAAAAVQSAQPAPDGGGPTTAPSTQPGQRRNRGGRGPVAFVSRFHDMVWGLSGLSDDQKTTLTPIFDQAKADATKLAAETRGMDPQDRRDKMQSFMSDLQGKVDPVLTDDQKSELQDKMSQMRPGGGGGRGGGGGGGGPTTQPGG
jgi:Spy/CpxP family protein refolding chaperone